MRAVVLDPDGQPVLTEADQPSGAHLRVLACGLCGSDVEKIGAAPEGTVLGHEVVAQRSDGTRAALFHHLPCGECERCRAGHESTCERFAAPTIIPGGFAEAVAATSGVELAAEIDDAIGTYVEPLACVLRGAERLPRGRVLVVGQGFIGKLFAEVLRHRGDTVFARDIRPARDGPAPDGPVDGLVLCAPAAPLDALAPGGTVLVFASAGPVDLDEVYRRELTLVGSRSATPAAMQAAAALLPKLDVPEPTVLPLARFAEGLELYRSGRAAKVVFTP